MCREARAPLLLAPSIKAALDRGWSDDACVLYPASIRDLLIRLAGTGLFQARWTDRILDECFASIVVARPELEGKLGRTRQLMEKAIPDARVCVLHAITAQAASLRSPPCTVPELLDTLESRGLVQSASELRNLR